MIKIKRKVNLELEPVEVIFTGNFHEDEYEEGNFYYSVTAHVASSNREIQSWERSVESRLRNQLKQQNIEKELAAKSIKELNKLVRKGVRK